MNISNDFKTLLDRASVTGAAYPDRVRIAAFLQKEATAEEQNIFHKMVAFIPEEQMLEAPHVASLAESLGKGAKVIHRGIVHKNGGAASSGAGYSKAIANYDFAAVAAQYGQPSHIVKVIGEDASGNFKMIIQTPTGQKIVSVPARPEKPKFYEAELAGLIQAATQFPSLGGWTREDCCLVSKYLAADGTPAQQAAWRTIFSSLGYQERLGVSQIITFSKSIGLESAIYDQKEIDAKTREREMQKSKATVAALGNTVKAAANLNVILAGAGKLPNAAWHEQFSARPLAENCAAVEKLLAAAPFTSQDDGLRVFHVRNLIIAKLSPAAEATTAARPAPAETATAKARSPFYFAGAYRPTTRPASAIHFGGAIRPRTRPAPVAGEAELQWRAEYQAADPKLRAEFPTFATYRAYRKNQPGAQTRRTDAHLAKLEAIGAKFENRFAPQFAVTKADAIGERFLQSGQARVSGRQPASFVAPPESAAPLTAADYESEWRATPELHAEFPTAKIYAAFQKANRVGAVNI